MDNETNVVLEQTKKKFELTPDMKKKLMMGGVLALTFVAGFATGGHRATKLISKGLEKCWEADPGLKKHMFKTAFDVIEKM